MEKHYKENFIAFLDILGFKELITREECDAIFKIFDEIHSRSKASLKYNGVQIDAYNHIHHKILSDSVIVFIDAEIDDAFAAMLDICTRLQVSLANRDNPILLRGGISKGPLYYEDDIIYGQGLTDAYLLESKLAKYPRIIFTGDTLELGKKNVKYMFPDLRNINWGYRTDEDGLLFVNYMPEVIALGLDGKKLYADRLFSLCNTMLNKAVDSSLREKYLWLKRTIEKSLDHFGQLKDMYIKEEQERREAEFAEYNERMLIYSEIPSPKVVSEEYIQEKENNNV